MPRVVFTAHLRNVAPPDPLDVEGDTVAEALDRAFELYPTLRSYVLDDQGRQRKHVAIFLNGEMLPRNQLTAGLNASSEVFVLQALSGG